MALERIRLLRNVIIEGCGEGKIGEEFELSRLQCAMLVGDGAAEFVRPQAKNYAVQTVTPEHGDPAPRKVSTVPTRVKKDE